jgi:H+/gluconate symporter-like permease
LIGPFYAIPFVPVTVYIWKKLRKKYNIWHQKEEKGVNNKVVDYLIKITLAISVYAIWLIILMRPAYAMFDFCVNFSDAMALSYGQFFNDFLIYSPLYAIPLTVISIYLWKICGPRRSRSLPKNSSASNGKLSLARLKTCSSFSTCNPPLRI